MTQKTEPVVLSANAASLHCQHRSASGRRFCRMPISDPATGLCFKHAAEQKKERNAANVAARLVGDTQEFTSAVTINRSLGELYKLLARDEIAPRRAAVLAYTCNLLLHTLPAIERELRPKEQDNILVWDVDASVAHRAQDPERALYENLATHYGSYATPTGLRLFSRSGARPKQPVRANHPQSCSPQPRLKNACVRIGIRANSLGGCG